MEQPIIEPVSLDLIKAELTPEKKLRDTNKGGNEIYVIDWKDSPNILREIGRLREITFRAAGGGTGKAADIDEFDLMENPCISFSKTAFSSPSQSRLSYTSESSSSRNERNTASIFG